MTLLLLDAPCFKREPGDCVAMVGYDFPIPEGDVSKATVESSRACTPKNGGPHWAQAWKEK